MSSSPKRVSQLLRSPAGLRHAEFACGAATEKVVALLNGVFLQRPADPIHHMLQHLHRQQQEDGAPAGGSGQGPSGDAGTLSSFPDATLFGEMRKKQALAGLISALRGDLAVANAELVGALAEEARRKADAVSAAVAAERAGWEAHWRRGGGVILKAPGRLASIKRTERRLTAPLPPRGPAHSLGHIARRAAFLAVGLTVERLLAVCIEAGRKGREQEFSHRASQIALRRASGGGATAAAVLAAAAAESAPALAAAAEARRRAAAAEDAAYYEMMNVGVPTAACESSVGCVLTAPLTAGRALVEAAANVADMCIGFTVERLVACGHEGGCGRREQMYQRKAVAQRKASMDTALPQSVAAAAREAGQAAEAARDAERAKQMAYFDLMNILPPERLLNEDDDLDVFTQSVVIINVTSDKHNNTRSNDVRRCS